MTYLRALALLAYSRLDPSEAVLLLSPPVKLQETHGEAARVREDDRQASSRDQTPCNQTESRWKGHFGPA